MFTMKNITCSQSEEAAEFYSLKPGANESKKNKRQETKRFSTFGVYRLRHSETKEKQCLIREICF